LREARFCISSIFILKPFAHNHVAGFLVGRAGAEPFGCLVMVILPPGRASLSEVIVIV
jgi:hypothetical protein